MIVVADTSPLRYLVLIERIDVLPTLYGRVIVPPAVIAELSQEHTPAMVRAWLSDPPNWLNVRAPKNAMMTEGITLAKHPSYAKYQSTTSRLIPLPSRS